MCGILKCGVASMEELLSIPGRPTAERMEKGPVAIIECVQGIPCNPCEVACPKNAITVGERITNLPALDGKKCIGCGLCIAQCPGLAIFVVDKNYSETETTGEFPFEYQNLPVVGDEVEAVSRFGKTVCKGKVLQIRNLPSFNHTTLVKIAIPKEYVDEVRSMKRRTSK